jgi:hypothetical protein
MLAHSVAMWFQPWIDGFTGGAGPFFETAAGSARDKGTWHAIPVRENRDNLPLEHEKVAGRISCPVRLKIWQYFIANVQQVRNSHFHEQETPCHTHPGFRDP